MPPQGRLRVLLADDHGVLRESLQMLLEAQAEIDVVATCGNGVEAVALAEKAGIDPHVLHEVINASSGTSEMFADRVPMMLGASERTTAAIDIFVKDLSLVADLGAALRARLPLTQNALRLFSEASSKGMGAHNDSEVIRLLQAKEQD